jgi:hypothetical protein
MLSQTFQFKAARTYQFSYYVANVSPQPDNVPPVISVSTSSGMPILAHSRYRERAPFFSRWPFSSTVSGAYTIYMLNHEDRGGYGGARGGNDFILMPSTYDGCEQFARVIRGRAYYFGAWFGHYRRLRQLLQGDTDTSAGDAAGCDFAFGDSSFICV